MLPRARARQLARFWLAALVLALLAPGVSAALAQARGELTPWQDICRSPASQAGSKTPAPLEQLTHGHCAACLVVAAAITPPPASLTQVALRNDLRFEAPERLWHAPQTAHAWAAPAARAPPALS